MSNAAVINATNSSGLSAGSPITIETGGDVKFVAAGKFTGVGFVTLAFAPYSGGKAGVPTLITITNEIPLKRTSAIGTGATQFVGWVADSSGTWEATGIAIGDSDGEALSDDLGTFPDVASLPTKALRVGATCKVAGVLQVWNGSAWAAMGGGAGGSANLLKSIPLGLFGPNLYIPGDQVGGNIIAATYVSETGVNTSNAGYFVAKAIPVTPGEKYIVCGAESTMTAYGGYYNGSTWVASIRAQITNGVSVVPAGVDNMRINVAPAWASTGAIYIRKVLPYASSLSTSIGSICALGDSITYGLNTSAIWWQLAGNRMGSPTFTNLGISGSTVAYPGSNPMSRRLSALVEADLIIFMGGYNDHSGSNIPLGVNTDTTDTTFYGALYVVGMYMLQKFPLSKIIWCTSYRTPTNGVLVNGNGFTIGDYNTAVRYMADKFGFMLCDFEKRMPNMHNYPLNRSMLSDGSHVNEVGARYMADLLIQSVYGHA